MNTKRIIFWSVFLIILALIVWGLAVSMSRPLSVSDVATGTPTIVTESDHVQGSATAPVTVIEYSDFQCPACESYYWSVAKLLQDESSTTVRFVYRHFPLPQHANAVPASMAAEAAGLQGKFWEMYDLIFKNHTDWTESSDPTKVFIGYATRIGLDINKFTADLSSPISKQAIDSDIQSGQVAGINATPTFFINGKAIVNPSSYAEFKKLIDQAASSSSR